VVTRVIQLCARNPGPVLVATAAALLCSAWSVRRLQLDAVPDVSEPQVLVLSEWMGRSPTRVEDQVTYPLVTALVPARGVTAVRGTSMPGMSFVQVVFEEGTDLRQARSQVAELLPSLHDRLPEGVAPRLGPDAAATGWIFQYRLVDRSGRRGLDELRAFQDFTLRYALGAVPGVAEVATVGGQQRQYQVVIDPDRLRAHGVGLPEVVAAVRDAGEEVGGGVLELSGREYYLRGGGSVQAVDDLEAVAVRGAGPDGAPVLLRDLAEVHLGPDARRGILDWNGEGEAVGGVVVMRQGENALQVIERVKARLEALRPGFPAGVEVETAYDRSGLVQRAVATLRRAVLEEGLVVAAVVLAFLLHLRSALVPILSLPVVVALAFVPMALLGIPATIMSLGGIAIALGATVDAEIVMIEACHRKLEHAPPGADRRALLAEAGREVTPALFFSLLVVAAAFLPVFTLTGRAGRLFAPLAWTKTFVMLAAAVLSVTLAPVLRDLLVRGPVRPESRHALSRLVTALYRPFVFVALRRPRTTLLIGLLAILSAVPLARRLGQEFMPPLDEGDLLYMPTSWPGLSAAEAARQLRAQDRVLRSFPEVESVFGKAGRAETATDPAPLSMVETTVRLRPPERWRAVRQARWYSAWAPAPLARLLRLAWPEERRITRDELVAELSQAMRFPGWTAAYTQPIQARVDMLASGVRTPVGLKLLGSSIEELDRMGAALERILAPVPGTRSVLYERSAGGLYLDLIPRREALARSGLTVADLHRAIEAAVGGVPAGTAAAGRSRFAISVRYQADLRTDLDRLRGLPVVAGGARVPAAAARPAVGPPTAPDGGGHRPGHAATTGALVGIAREGPEPGAAADLAALPLVDQAALSAAEPSGAGATFPLGELATLRIVGGPAMVRDENGFLAGYVHVDADPGRRDLRGYVADARAAVAAAQASGVLRVPEGHSLEWTGQHLLLEQLHARLRLILPLTLLLVVGLLWLLFRNLTEALIVLLSVPFALVGSVWLLWLLDYRLSTAVWVGIIALVGLAAQTGVVMIVYIDAAFERRRRAGRIRDPSDVVWAHLEGTVQRVRPKLMTVATMLGGLLPLLWATGSGADVLRRLAAPMVGGLVTSAFLTLELIPVVYTYWRQEQLLWERLAALDPARLRSLVGPAVLVRAGLAAAALATASPAYLDLPAWAPASALAASAGAALAGALTYLGRRPAAARLAWAGRPAPLDLAAPGA
jgi:copper/silver efflux system protein